MTCAEKEMEEGPEVLEKTEEKRELVKKRCQDLEFDQVILTGCGSSFNVSLVVAAEMRSSDIDALAVEASEILFSGSYVDNNTLLIGFSQSGETSETARVIEESSEKGAETLAIVNREKSTISEISDTVVKTPAGEEDAALATKSVDSALLTGLLVRDSLSERETSFKVEESFQVSIEDALEVLENSKEAYVLGIGSYRGIAAEAATKLGEVPLIHATHMTTLEFSHGPKSHAEDVPVVILAMQPELEEVYRESIAEFTDAGARTLVVSPEGLDYSDEADVNIETSGKLFSTLKIIQRLSIQTALRKGCDPDNPPNLSKHVERPEIEG
ncbi:MAG: SIS domain-containing protein [Candidatus Nanohaloarchaea archaeon]